MKKYFVDLTGQGRNYLRAIIQQKKASSAEITRARVLLLADKGESDSTIAQALDLSLSSVQRIRKKLVEGGLRFAIADQPPARPRQKLTNKQEILLRALAAGEPPDGRGHWTTRLLAEKLVAIGIVDSISDGTVRRVLKRSAAQPKGGVMSDQDIVIGSYGRIPMELHKNAGILKANGKEAIMLRVRTINLLFGSIARNPLISTLLRRGGIAIGTDYAITWILVNKSAALPAELQKKGEEFLNLQEAAEAESLDSTPLTTQRTEVLQRFATDLDRLLSEIKPLVLGWVSSQPDAAIRALWQEMLDEDAEAGWGKATLTDFDRAQERAEIRLKASFIARLFYYWYQQNKGGGRICSFLEGYFLGEARVLFALEHLDCYEQQCHLEGGDECVFIVEPEKTHS